WPAGGRSVSGIAGGGSPPVEPKLWPPYREACLELGKPAPGEYPNQGPIFLWVSKEPDKDWDRLMPHVLHQLRSYSEWTIEAYGRPSGPFAKQMTPETVRESPAYRVLTPEQTLALAEPLGAPRSRSASATPSRCRSTPCCARPSGARGWTISVRAVSSSGSRCGSRRWTTTPSARDSGARRSGTIACAPPPIGCASARC